ncbi:hypothetical protein BOX15_Mlig027239g2 [Macrostomum lignano]|uniref:Apple domain-containing protein n=2 Tax=Macrostomum lignano TaxID=282301 RepID=A0A267EWK4_9PLAT|nr:hypothetical protein BOX15_Mlig024945g1 [Macrostomum lignano]PAA76544.1 hypothetical protein BOX15_Mlig027239g2 [Macrostomum lignano]
MAIRQLVAWILLALAVISCQFCGFANGEFCQKVNTTEGVGLPYIPPSYQTRIEMNILTKNQTYEFQEWFDGYLGNVRIRRYQKDGEIDDYIYNNATREIYVIFNDLVCLVINMTGKTDLDLLFGVDGRLLPSSALMLRFSKEFGMEYRNKSIVRGITVDYWYSCQTWKERKAVFEVHWYFSASSWNTPYDVNLPVRAEVIGEAGDVSNPRKFHMIYDFVSFRDVLMAENTIFDTPTGVYCEDRMQVQKPPELPAVMSYTQEMLVHDPALEMVQYGNVYYDGSQFLVKYQFRDPNGDTKPPFYNPGSMTVIQDFTTGISYFIDDLIGNCTDKPISNDFFDTEDPPIKDRPGWDIIELRSPKDLFRIDETYQFTGKRVVRGIPIHRYISLRKDYEIKGRPGMNFTFEYEMLDPRVSEVVLGKNKINQGKNIPVQLRITNYKSLGQIDDPTFNYQEVYNFYNFDTQVEPDAEKDFDQLQPYDLDVTQCYAKAERKNILIRFLNGGIYDKYVKGSQNLFIRRATKVLANADLGFVNPIRFQRVRLDYDDVFIYLIFTLLDGPHPYAQFNRLTGPNRYIESAEQTANVASELDCLRRCNSLLMPPCNSVAFCPGSKSGSNCLLSSSFKKDTENPDKTHQCSVLIRPVSVIRPDALELSLETAFDLLVTYVDSSLFRVPMEKITPETGNIDIVNITALDIEQFEVRPNVDLALTGRHLFQFEVTKSAGMPPTRAMLDALSVDDCAEACLGNADFECKSFTYCYSLGQCLLNDASPREQPDKVVQRGLCNLYDKTELGLFTKEPGLSRLIDVHKDLQLVDTDRECAAACVGSSPSKPCRSFDICDFGEGLKKFCYLSASHKSDDSVKSEPNLNCTHYSRSFTTDFKQQFKVSQPDLSAYTATHSDLNLDYCSRRCVEDYGEKCNGFYYCEPYNGNEVRSTCSIRVPGVALVTKPSGSSGVPSCAYYSRQYDTDGSIWIERNDSVNPGDTIGLSAVATVLAVLGILLVSILVGMGFIGIYLYCKNRPLQMEEPGVQFSR